VHARCRRGAAKRRCPPGDLDRGAAPPLVVDLDGPLRARRTWRACLCRLVHEQPWWIPLLPYPWLLLGGAILMGYILGSLAGEKGSSR
jgi:hypothetical protein